MLFIVLEYLLCASLSGALENVGMLTVLIIGGQDLLCVGLWMVVNCSVMVLHLSPHDVAAAGSLVGRHTTIALRSSSRRFSAPPCHAPCDEHACAAPNLVARAGEKKSEEMTKKKKHKIHLSSLLDDFSFIFYL